MVAKEEPDEEENPDDEFYLDNVSKEGRNSKSWKVKLMIQNKPIMLKIDTGAEVTAISEADWNSLPSKPAIEETQRTYGVLKTHPYRCRRGYSHSQVKTQ